MCRPTSEEQDRVIDQPIIPLEMSMMMTHEPFLSAEIAYRQQRAAAQYGGPRRRRHWVPRRPTLKVPHIHRPLQIAE
jgi:hypothetical protein